MNQRDRNTKFRILLIGALLSFSFAHSQIVNAAVVVQTLTSSASTPSGGLVGWWTLDRQDISQNVRDRSINDNTGYKFGNTATGTGIVSSIIGQGFNFDGSSDYILVPDANSLDLSTKGSLSAWFKTSTGGVFQIIAGKNNLNVPNDGYLLFLDTSNKLSFRWDNTGTTNQIATTQSYNDGLWHHAVGVQSGSGLTIYVDGVAVKTGGTGSTLANSTYPFKISYTSIMFNGVLDDIRLYSRDLSKQEVQRLYSMGLQNHISVPLAVHGSAVTGAPTLSNGLLAYYSLNSSDLISNVRDTSGNARHQVLYHGGTGTTTIAGHIGQALRFDGSDDYSYMPAHDAAFDLDGAGDKISVSYWAKRADSSGNLQEVVSTYGSDNIGWLTRFYNNDFSWHLSLGGGGDAQWDSSNTYTDQAWHLWTVTFITGDASSLHVYRDGIEITGSWTTGTGNEIPGAGIGRLSLGANDVNGAPSSYYNGSLDEVRIYNRILTQSEILSLYRQGASTYISTTIKSSVILRNGLVGHWTFDGKDMTSNVADLSGQGNNGNLSLGSSGNTSTTTDYGRLGQAIKLDGVDDYVRMNGIDPGAAGTVSLWVKSNGNYSNQQAFLGAIDSGGSANNTGYLLEAINTGACASGDWFTIVSDSASNQVACSGDVYNATNFPAGKWQNIAFTYNGSNILFYKNGVQIKNVTQTVSGDNAAQLFSIGRIGGFDGFYYKGSVDDVRLYNRALSADEVKRLYDLGK